MYCDLERPAPWDNTLVLESILDSSEAIVNGILHLSYGVLVGSLWEQGGKEER